MRLPAGEQISRDFRNDLLDKRRELMQQWGDYLRSEQGCIVTVT